MRLESLVESVVTIALAITGIAVIAVLVSRNANTSQIITSGGSAFSESLEAAEAPVLNSDQIAPGFNEFM